MAEEKTPEQIEEEKKRIEALNKYIDQQTDARFAQLKEDWEKQQKERGTQNPDPAKKSDDPIGEMVQEALTPTIQSIGVELADIKDSGAFYRDNPDASDYAADVEAQFKLMKEQGRPVSREEILSYVMGKKMREDREGFIDKEIERRNTAVKLAAAEGDAGIATLAKTRPELADPEALSQEDLTKALEGVTF